MAPLGGATTICGGVTAFAAATSALTTSGTASAASATGVGVGTMAGGALVLIEPPGIVTLNRELAQAVDAEKSAIDAIKRELSNAIALVVEELFACLEIVIKLDVIAAKCRYSQALNGVRPEFSVFADDDDGFYEAYEDADEDEDEDIGEQDDEGFDEAREQTKKPPIEKSSLLLELVGLRQPVLASQAIEAAAERRQAAAHPAGVLAVLEHKLYIYSIPPLASELASPLYSEQRSRRRAFTCI